MTDERRQHPRVSADTVVRMHFSTIGEFMQSQAENISAGGMQLVTARPLAVGDLVGLEFRLISNYPLIEGTATVKWCRPDGQHFRVGVEFGQLDERSVRVIEEAVRHRERSAAEVTEDLLVAPDDFDDTVELEPDSAVLDVETADLEPSDVEPPAMAQEPWDVEEVVADLAPPEALDVEASTSSGSFDDDAAVLDAGVDWGDVSVDADFESASTETFDFGDVPAEVADLTPPPAEAAAPAGPPQPGIFEFEDLPPAEESVGEASFDAGRPIGSINAETAATASTAGSRPRRKGLLIGLLVGAVLALGLIVWGLMPRDGGDELGGVGDPAAAPVPAVPAAPIPGLEPGPGAATVAAAAPPALTAPTEDPPPAPKSAPANAAPAPAPVPTPAAEPKPEPEPKPVAASATGPASTIVGIRAGEGRTLLTVEGDGSWQGKYRTFALKAPARIVVDLQETSLAKGVRAPGGSGAVQNVRVGRHEGKIRIVLDLTADTPYSIDLDGNRLHVRRR